MQRERRIEALETKMRKAVCATCREWPSLAVVHIVKGDEEIPPSTCPHCEREARKVITITRRTDGPQ